MPNIIGTKWGAPTLGTKGGVVTWSLVGAGEGLGGFGVGNGRSVTGDSFLSYDFRQVISDAFAEWSSHGNIEFIQVQDKGGSVGASSAADIRIFFGDIPGNIIGYGFFPTRTPSAFAGDILLDTDSSFNSNQAFFSSLVLHEQGHALGLGHVSSRSVMTPIITGSGLELDDILGIQDIYGIQDGADPTYRIKGGGEFRILEGLDNLKISGNLRNNKIFGTDHDEEIGGARGSDLLVGNGGSDTLTGGTGRDTLKGGAGADYLDGGSARDTADYGDSVSAISFDLSLTNIGRAGDSFGDRLISIEKIFGGRGDDTILGDDGVDRFRGAGGDDSLAGRGGDDVLLGMAGNDTLDGGDGDDRLEGDTGDDLLRGMADRDTLRGEDGGDTLEGGDGGDSLFGGRGSDVLDGGAGRDVIRGGSSADVFVFYDGHGDDRIGDFETGVQFEVIDLINVSALNDFDDVIAASTNTLAGVLIDTGGGDSILLSGVRRGLLEVDDFLF